MYRLHFSCKSPDFFCWVLLLMIRNARNAFTGVLKIARIESGGRSWSFEVYARSPVPSFVVTATYTSHTEIILVPIESWDQGLSIGTKNIHVR